MGIIEKFSRKPISKFHELHRYAPDILNLVTPGDLEGPLSTSPDTVIIKGRHKKDSTKRDKSH